MFQAKVAAEVAAGEKRYVDARVIPSVALAIEMGADATDIGLTIHPHPTLSETVGLSAEAFDGTLTYLFIPKH